MRSSKAKGTDANAALEARIGHSFADPNLLMQGITHVSALKSGRKRGDSYQRLEFLGDHVLGLVVSDMLYHAFPNADEGDVMVSVVRNGVPVSGVTATLSPVQQYATFYDGSNATVWNQNSTGAYGTVWFPGATAKLERGARRYYVDHLAPGRVIERLVYGP